MEVLYLWKRWGGDGQLTRVREVNFSLFVNL